MMNKEKKLLALDKLLIDELTKSFFNIFTNKKKKRPNWGLINEVCLKEINIIKTQKLKQEIYNLEEFITPRKQILSDGTLQDFEEEEISAETKIIGNIAQRSSRYKKRGVFDGIHFEQFGNKFFHYVKTNKGWLISSVIWEDE